MMDANISPHRILTRDLDGDGFQEIIAGTAACNNLNGALEFGLGDHSSRIMVLNASGELVWQRELAGTGGSTIPLVTDLDGDGQFHIVALSAQPQQPRSLLTVWRGDGALMDRIELPADIVTNIVAFGAEGDRPGTVVALRNVEGIISFQWLEEHLVRHRDVAQHSWKIFALDAIAELPGDELVFDTRDQLVLMDRNLNELAAFNGLDGRPYFRPLMWNAAMNCRRLLIPDGESRGMIVVPTPRTIPYALFAGGGTVLLGAVGAAFQLRRRLS